MELLLVLKIKDFSDFLTPFKNSRQILYHYLLLLTLKNVIYIYF
jgi:hypothetical protein